jgi:regulator of sirC expression with transglutaminase-like and TPR domain
MLYSAVAIAVLFGGGGLWLGNKIKAAQLERTRQQRNQAVEAANQYKRQLDKRNKADKISREVRENEKEIMEQKEPDDIVDGLNGMFGGVSDKTGGD